MVGTKSAALLNKIMSVALIGGTASVYRIRPAKDGYVLYHGL